MFYFVLAGSTGGELNVASCEVNAGILSGQVLDNVFGVSIFSGTMHLCTYSCIRLLRRIQITKK